MSNVPLYVYSFAHFVARMLSRIYRRKVTPHRTSTIFRIYTTLSSSWCILRSLKKSGGFGAMLDTIHQRAAGRPSKYTWDNEVSERNLPR